MAEGLATMGTAPIFSDIDQIKFEGPETDNQLAYRFYNKDQAGAWKAHGRSFAHGGLLLAHFLLGRR